MLHSPRTIPLSLDIDIIQASTNEPLRLGRINAFARPIMESLGRRIYLSLPFSGVPRVHAHIADEMRRVEWAHAPKDVSDDGVGAAVRGAHHGGAGAAVGDKGGLEEGEVVGVDAQYCAVERVCYGRRI